MPASPRPSPAKPSHLTYYDASGQPVEGYAYSNIRKRVVRAGKSAVSADATASEKDKGDDGNQEKAAETKAGKGEPQKVVKPKVNEELPKKPAAAGKDPDAPKDPADGKPKPAPDEAPGSDPDDGQAGYSVPAEFYELLRTNPDGTRTIPKLVPYEPAYFGKTRSGRRLRTRDPLYDGYGYGYGYSRTYYPYFLSAPVRTAPRVRVAPRRSRDSVHQMRKPLFRRARF